MKKIYWLIFAALTPLLISAAPATGDKSGKILLIIGGVVAVIIVLAVIVGRRKYRDD